jgi:hypothetical protein
MEIISIHNYEAYTVFLLAAQIPPIAQKQMDRLSCYYYDYWVACYL